MAKTSKEKEIQNLMSSLQISREEAEELWRYDHDENIKNEEADSLTDKAKKNTRTCEQSSVTHKSYSRERKVDTEKKAILEIVNTALFNAYNIQGEVKTETEINFMYNENSYTLKLTKHKPPKQ